MPDRGLDRNGTVQSGSVSFRGEDTRNTFVSHLYKALEQHGIKTYKDDEKIKKGETINNQLIESNEDSRFLVIMFSMNYASSSWCLDELVKIMECQKVAEQTAYPVFMMRSPLKEALKEAADLAGWELKKTANGADEKLVGMEMKINDVLSSLKIGVQDVRMIEIKGIGGGGKTTLSRAVYDQISNQFEGKSFVENLEALCGASNWFKPGSKIIITTRDEQVLVAYRVNFVHIFVYKINLLSADEVICLFSRYAFEREIPIEEYKDLSGEVVKYADGLPLTIKVLEATMEKLEISYNGLEADYKEIFLDISCLLEGWYEDKAIRTLESCCFYARNGLRVIEQKSLIQISKYGVLDMHDHIQEMGRLIVRRLHPDKPYRHSRVGTKATKCIKLRTKDLHVKGLANLKELRFLTVYSLNNEVSGSEDDCYGSDQESDEVLHKLRFLDIFDLKVRTLDLRLTPNLEMLHIIACEDLNFTGTLKSIKLRSLKLSHSKLMILKLGVTPNLVELILKDCNDLVELNMLAKSGNLRSLKLSNSKLRILDLEITLNLIELILEDCKYLIELHMPVDSLYLRSFKISHSNLRILDLGFTLDLAELILKDCNDLVELYMPASCLSLISLGISYTIFRNLDLRIIPNLKTLSLKDCLDLIEHMSSKCPQLISLGHSKLRTLHLRNT
uniref:TIR domain-containing protein n=1 Tax=Tanacetum cinerariifolium TaxID=118510 RepID=A0A6L2KS70_TANCI|nr:hypothetical protein [Tanacetum cinerariifolium]